MRRLSDLTAQQLVDYNLRAGGHEFTIFADTQPDRVAKARLAVSALLPDDHAARIVEPGCSTGDISGFFAKEHHAIGIDVTPGAAEAARQRWPQMHVIEGRIEDVTPMACDVLVLCEFLEHIVDPIGFVAAWLPLAGSVVIGHPLVGDGNDPEPGHVWAYDYEDFTDWFRLGGHTLWFADTFTMGPYRMALGAGVRT